MADIISSNPNLSIAGPSLGGGYIPSIDRRMQIDGLATVTPWGGGTAFQSQSSGGSSGISTDESSLQISELKNLILSRPTGDTINYSIEGIIGPPGPAGPAGPQGLPTPPILGITGGAAIPTRILDDGATPSAPTSLVATAMIEAIMLEWDPNTEPDMDHYEVYRNTEDNSSTATKIAEAYQTLLVDGDKSPSQEYFYWIKAVDHLGNTSDFSTGDSTTPLTQSTAGPLSLKVSGTLSDTDATGNYNQAGQYNSADCYVNANSWYIWWDSGNTKWVISDTLGTAGTEYWDKSNDPVVGTFSPRGTATGDAVVAQGGGPWNTADIVDDAITTAKVAASAITAAKTNIAVINSSDGTLNANSVGNTQIQDTAIDGPKIAAGAIVAAKTNLAAINPNSGNITDDHITSNMIRSDTIEARHIVAGAVTAEKIQTINFFLSDGIWESDSPSAGYVAWSKCKVCYNGTEHTIDDGNTTDKFIYWKAGVVSISGTLTPEVTGRWYYNGIYNTKECYKDVTGAYYLYWNSAPFGAWVVSNSLGGLGSVYWVGGATMAGAYNAYVNCTGTLTVTAVQSPVSYFYTSNTLPTLGESDFMVAENLQGTHLLVWNSTIIDGGRIRTGSVTATQIQASTITANELATGCVTSDKVYAGAITADKITSVTVEPLDTYTKLCSTFNGENGDTTFTDPIQGTAAFYGTAQLSTAQKMFGVGSSLLLDGNSDYITYPASSDWDFGGGDFTVDFRVYFNAISRSQVFYSHTLDNSNRVDFYITSGNRLQFYAVSGGTQVANYVMTSAWSGLATGVWNHIALVRHGSTIKMYINGVAQVLTETTPIGTLPTFSSTVLTIGNYSLGGSYYVNGYLDEYRVSKGIARWLTDFTPPVSSYISTPSAGSLTYISGGKILTGYLQADQINTNTITSDKVLNVDASKILINGTTYLSNWRGSSDVTKINGGQIDTASITADKINVNSLSAISSNIGTITAGTITADVITAGTINANVISNTTLSGVKSKAYKPAGTYVIPSVTKGNIPFYSLQTLGTSPTWASLGVGSNFMGVITIQKYNYNMQGSLILSLYRNGGFVTSWVVYTPSYDNYDPTSTSFNYDITNSGDYYVVASYMQTGGDDSFRMTMSCNLSVTDLHDISVFKS